MRRYIAMLLILTIPSPATSADQGQQYQSNVSWAQQADGLIRNQSGYNTFNADELCKDAACRQGVANPEQTRYRNDATAMESAKTAAMATDEKAQAVTSNFNKGRPTIDPTDPTWAIATGIQDNAYNISHGLSDKYTDCSGSGKQCVTDVSHHTCQTLRTEPLTCIETVTKQSHWDRWSQRSYGPEYIRRKHASTMPPLPANTLYLGSITFTQDIMVYGDGPWSNYNKCPTSFPGTTTITINGVPQTVAQRVSCTTSGSSNRGYKHYTNHYISAQTVPVNRKVTGNITIGYPSEALKITNASIQLNFVERHITMQWSNSCAQNPETASCGLTSNQCIEGAGTRIISGVPVFQSCWKYKKTYQCGQGEVDTCKQYDSCQQTDNQCSQSVNGQCIKWSKKFTCESETCSDTTLICGEQSYCLDGDCFAPGRTANSDFNQAASALAALGEAAKGLGDPPMIFTGKPMHCTKKAIGFSDCCKDGGWGTDIGLAKCDEEDKAVAKAKEDKLTVSLGEYCAEKVLGACIRKKKTYCVFDSKLARIVQEQGRPQIGLNFGSAKNPDCSAITPEQMQQMDFSNIDFSDFYTDLHSTMTLPDSGQVQQRVEQAMKEKQ